MALGDGVRTFLARNHNRTMLQIVNQIENHLPISDDIDARYPALRDHRDTSFFTYFIGTSNA